MRMKCEKEAQELTLKSDKKKEEENAGKGKVLEAQHQEESS